MNGRSRPWQGVPAGRQNLSSVKTHAVRRCRQGPTGCFIHGMELLLDIHTFTR